MNRGILALLLITFSALSHAAPNVWKSGFGQGKTEFFVGDEQTNYLNFACGADEDPPIAASATINGKPFYSNDDEGGFDVIVDGVEYENPFNVDCRVCASNFETFWKALRKAGKIEIKSAGQSAQIPVKGLSQLLKPYKSDQNPCVASFW